MQEKIPTISICNLLGKDYTVQDFLLYDLADFIQTHQNILFPHHHSFYQVLYITKGKGTRIIDFEKFPIKKGMLYFLSPAQFHDWQFDKNTQGILINFNYIFFTSFLAKSYYHLDFPFFNGIANYSSEDFSNQNESTTIEMLFNTLVKEYHSRNECKLELMKTLLLQIFLTVNRNIAVNQNQTINKCNYLLLRNFETLIEAHYTKLRLPKDYAELLFVTPNHLNDLCNHVKGKAAGELIRYKILLEAKRLLVNSNQNINEIA
jgi:AraC family transcriptional activator of pobA